jgi:hypothetical protein
LLEQSTAFRPRRFGGVNSFLSQAVTTNEGKTIHIILLEQSIAFRPQRFVGVNSFLSQVVSTLLQRSLLVELVVLHEHFQGLLMRIQEYEHGGDNDYSDK